MVPGGRGRLLRLAAGVAGARMRDIARAALSTSISVAAATSGGSVSPAMTASTALFAPSDQFHSRKSAPVSAATSAIGLWDTRVP